MTAQDRPSQQALYRHKLKTSNDIVFIEKVISQGDEGSKFFLAENPNLNDVHIEVLGNDTFPSVRNVVALRKDVPPHVLQALRKDKIEDVWLAALLNPLTDFIVIKNFILTEKLSTDSLYTICDSFRILENVEVFEFLWTTYPRKQSALFSTLDWAYFKEYPYIDPECVQVIHDTVKSGNTSKILRELYATYFHIAIPEILDTLKDDSHRPVINGIARNKSAWVSTHEYLVSKHKTPAIRISVARATQDNALLNRIYHGTKSKDIREAVEANPVFVDLHS